MQSFLAILKDSLASFLPNSNLHAILIITFRSISAINGKAPLDADLFEWLAYGQNQLCKVAGGTHLNTFLGI
jgi:hypothetical protein